MSALASEEFGGVLRRELRAWIQLTDAQIAELYVHYQLLDRWNEKMNLTSLKPGVELVIRHYCESLFFGAHLPNAETTANIADIGSGAGFPGVPIAVIRPNWLVTLIESNQRKAVFLREATRPLRNISVSASRAEEIAGNYDWVVSRAVHPEDVLANIPRLAKNVGLLLGELNYPAIKKFSSIAWSEPIRLPWGDRRLCVFGCST